MFPATFDPRGWRRTCHLADASTHCCRVNRTTWRDTESFVRRVWFAGFILRPFRK